MSPVDLTPPLNLVGRVIRCPWCNARGALELVKFGDFGLDRGKHRTICPTLVKLSAQETHTVRGVHVALPTGPVVLP
jgi:hypothetical protein